MGDGASDESVNDIEKVLNTIGISIRTSTMEFRDFSDVLDDVAEKWTSLSSVEKAAISGSLGGVRQRENVNALLENYDTYKEAVETASDAEGTAEEKFEAYSDSIEAALNRLKDAWDELAQKFEASGFFKGLVNTATFLVEQLPRILKLVATLFATMNAYKMPGWISQLADSFNPAKAVSTGRYKGARSILTTGGWQDRKNIRDYERYKERGDLDKAKALESQLPQAYKDTFVIPEDGGENAPMVKEQKTTNQKLDDIVQDVATIAGKAKAAPVSDVQTSIAEGYNGTATGSAIIEGVNDGIDPDPVRRARQELADLQTREKLTTSALGGLTSRQNERLMQNKAYGAQLNVLPEGGDEALAVIEKQSALQAKIHEKAELIKQTEQERLALVDQIAAKQREIDALLEKQKATQVEQNVASQSEVTTSLKIQATEAAISAEEQKQLAAQNQKNMAEAQELATDQAIAQAETNITTQDATQAALGAAGNATGATGGAGFNNLATIPGKQMLQNNGKAINAKPSAMQKAGGFLNKLSGGFKVSALSGVMGGLTSGITAFATQEGSVGDKAIAGVTNTLTTGLLSAIPGVGPILGATLGPILGDLFTDGILKLVHQEEIARQERVEEAKERLELLNSITSTVEGLEGAVKERSNWDSGDYEEVNNYISETMEVLRNDSGLKEAFLENAANMGYVGYSASELMDLIVTGTDEQAKQIVNALQLAQTSSTKETTYDTQEEERYQATKKIDEAGDLGNNLYEDKYGKEAMAALDGLEGVTKEYAYSNSSNRSGYAYSIGGDTAQDKLDNIYAAKAELEKKATEASEQGNTKLQEAYEELIDKLEAEAAAVEEGKDTIDGLNDEVNNQAVEEAFLSSVGSWDNIKIANSTLEEAIFTMAQDLYLSGEAVYDATGAITDEARTRIEKYLKSQDEFAGLFDADDTNLRQLLKGDKYREQLLGESGYSYEQAREIVDTYNPNNENSVNEMNALVAAVNANRDQDNKISMEDLVNQIYKLDPSGLENFAEALGMTTEEVAGLQKQLGNASVADLLGDPQDTIDEISDKISILSDYMSSGAMSAENYMKVLSTYPELLQEIDEETGKVVSISSDNIMGNLLQDVYGDEGNLGTLLGYQTYEDLKTNTGLYDSFKEMVKDNYTGSTDISFLETATTFSDDVLAKLSKDTDLWQMYMDMIGNMSVDTSMYQELVQSLIDYQGTLIDKEIEGLEAQKDALDDINESREKELDLIKARDALENAKKEKQLVYREGKTYALYKSA